MKFCSRHTAKCLLPLLAVIGSLLEVQGEEGPSSRSLNDEFTKEPSTINLISTVPSTYTAQRAAFGNPLASLFRANLMLPNEDATLCKFSDFFSTIPEGDPYDTGTFSLPVALFVSADGCSAEQKARVALQIQQNVTEMLRYVVIYGTDPNDNDEQLELQSDDPSTVDDDLNTIGILYVPFRYGEDLADRIAQRGVVLRADARFLQPENRRWNFFIRVANQSDTDPPFNPNQQQTYTGNPDSFYWFRFVLFSLLIVTPCFRAAYLWHAGGGRFHLRRDEQGRINGIQYIPPMAYWLSSGMRPIQNIEPRSTTLDAEQFDSLPEILYCPLPDMDDVVGVRDEPEEEIAVSKPPTSTNNAADALTIDIPSVTSLDLPNSAAVGDGDVNGGRSTATAEASPSEEENLDVERPTPVPTPIVDPTLNPAEEGGVVDLTTTCTVCSICIDEFEVGERLTLLPRCQHAFHKECISPWLRERQGCCPLCKKHVLGEEHDTDSERSGEEDSNANPSVPAEEQT